MLVSLRGEEDEAERPSLIPEPVFNTLLPENGYFPKSISAPTRIVGFNEQGLLGTKPGSLLCQILRARIHCWC